MSTNLILGTAGHIDHGKTSLTRALTGKETDRLPEEKKRGITIELGYAHLELPPYRLGIVDVPGHEKFVRQMLAGATGMDMAMLVVASDDSVKQQTREHLDILRLLDLPAGVIALTKCDLVEPDWLELVEDEIRQLVAGTFLENAPIVRTSSKTGMGIEELKEILSQTAAIAAESDRQKRLSAPFRMAIDRCFTMEGHGTVVTGSVSSGQASVGDQLLVQPGGHEVRIRGLQSHDSSTQSVQRGQRAAINLAGIHHDQVERGHELCAIGHLIPSQLMTVQISLLHSEKKPFKDRTRVRFHVGTTELFANVRLLGATELEPGQSGFAQLFLNEPAVATWNQPFVIRRQSPVVTIGGGRILHPNALRLRKPTELDLKMVGELTHQDELARANASLYFSNDPEFPAASLSRTAGVSEPQPLFERLVAEKKLVEIEISPTRTMYVQSDRFEEVSHRVIKVLNRLHDQHPLRFSHPLSNLDVEFAYLDQPQLLKATIAKLRQDKKVEIRNGTIGLVGRGPNLSKGERALMEQLIGDVKQYGTKPPTPKELQANAKKNKESVFQLLELAVNNGNLVKLSDQIYWHTEIYQEATEKVKSAIIEQDGITMSDIRQLIDTSRKYAVPFCEYLDEMGITQRDGDLRVLGPAALNAAT